MKGHERQKRQLLAEVQGTAESAFIKAVERSASCNAPRLKVVYVLESAVDTRDHPSEFDVPFMTV